MGIKVLVVTNRLFSKGEIVKLKVHSGAKKRLKVLSSGKIKHKKKGRRHILSNKNRKRKRNLKGNYYIEDANMDFVKRLLAI